MLAVSLKWRLGVVRRRPKGTKQEWGAGQTALPAQGLGGWTWVWMEGEAGERRGYLPLGPLLPALSLPASPQPCLFWCFGGFSSVSSLFLNLCMCLVSLYPSCCLLPPSPSPSGLFSRPLSLSLSPSPSLCLSESNSRSIFLSVCLSLSPSLTVSLCLVFSLSLHLSHGFCVCVCVSPSLSCCATVSFINTLPVPRLTWDVPDGFFFPPYSGHGAAQVSWVSRGALSVHVCESVCVCVRGRQGLCVGSRGRGAKGEGRTWLWTRLSLC